MTYRFGAMWYTIDQIRDIGFRHGCDGIMYYPPQQWDSQVFTRDQSGKIVKLCLATPLEAAYREGYRAGHSFRYGKTD